MPNLAFLSLLSWADVKMRPEKLLTNYVILLMFHDMTVPTYPGALHNLVAFLREQGLPVSSRLARHAAKKFLGGNLDALTPAIVIEAFDEAAVATSRPDLGVAFAQWLNVRSFSPVSLLAEQCPSLRYAVEARQRYMRVVNPAIIVEVEDFGDEVHIVHTVLPSLGNASTQFLAGTLLLSVRLGRRVLSADWTPVRVELCYQRPTDMRAHEYFRCPIAFSAERFVVVCKRIDIDRPLPGHDPTMLAFIEAYLDAQLQNWPSSRQAQVERLIAANLEGRRATLDHVADILGVTPRKLQRDLASANTSFGKILDQVRRRVAAEFFSRMPPRSMITLTHLLGYTDASTTSRFLSSTFSATGRELRSRCLAGVSVS